MYSLKSILDKEPVIVSGAVKAILAVLVITGVFELSAEALAGVVIALDAVLGLFVRQRSVSAATLAELAPAAE